MKYHNYKNSGCWFVTDDAFKRRQKEESLTTMSVFPASFCDKHVINCLETTGSLMLDSEAHEGVSRDLTDLLGGQVGHPSGHLVRSRHQLPDLQPPQGRLPRPAPVLQPDRSASPEELPQVPLGGVLHHHVQGA